MQKKKNVNIVPTLLKWHKNIDKYMLSKQRCGNQETAFTTCLNADYISAQHSEHCQTRLEELMVCARDTMHFKTTGGCG